MKKRTVVAASLLLVCLVGTMVAHPHFNKTVTAAVKGLELKLTYFTLPYNAKHLEGIKEGFVFHCGRAKLNVAGEMTVGRQRSRRAVISFVRRPSQPTNDSGAHPRSSAAILRTGYQQGNSS
jgi:hypothetical protein